MHVLVVDDDDAMTNLVADVLNEEGIRVAVASSLAAALSAVATAAPSLVLLDHCLPDGGGLANVSALKSAVPQPPAVLLFTAGQVDRSLLEASGADGYIGKPFELTTLIQEVSRWLSPSGAPTLAPQ